MAMVKTNVIIKIFNPKKTEKYIEAKHFKNTKKNKQKTVWQIENRSQMVAINPTIA